MLEELAACERAVLGHGAWRGKGRGGKVCELEGSKLGHDAQTKKGAWGVGLS